MGFVQRALFTWFILLVFLILLCLRLESRINWNWFIVFIPLWLYDTILITWVVIEIIQRQHANRLISFRHYEYYVAGILLKIVSQIAICLKLEYNTIPLYAMMVPIWCLLAMLIAYMAMNLLPKPRSIGTSKSSRQTATASSS
ncbi:transmembrane protein 60 [Toxorhynchites rutilus septentrionalis]|uniref:transmembrane protein 60 n=1 Tax=Toxorhynchites rutilus septentrionalis TaxID=329112 RepID=UPI00247B29B5|nr:transmembrane protein 60 [Toxorhynchites rutilus septentrionalis]XP_055620262.1 transmembrane protein 60 [Toxorhynchites rutilus septentrionalis]